jgi:hypothetical protein
VSVLVLVFDLGLLMSGEIVFVVIVQVFVLAFVFELMLTLLDMFLKFCGCCHWCNW